VDILGELLAPWELVTLLKKYRVVIKMRKGRNKKEKVRKRVFKGGKKVCEKRKKNG